MKARQRNNKMDRRNIPDEQDRFEDCPPGADALIHSLRAFGYDISMAIADLIDNSIFAAASSICVDYAWNEGDPWVRILDDGKGMNEDQLVEAMRLGSMSPLEDRAPEDLGRFGLGLKTASFSQCKLVTVCSKTAEGAEAVRFWDLDYVQSSKSWKLGRTTPRRVQPLLEPLSALETGTLVLWQNLDRYFDDDTGSRYDPKASFLERFLKVKEYLEMVFHKYLEDRRRPLTIRVGTAHCEPWDPYLRANDFTQELASERYEEKRVAVIPYVLPHVSKRNEQESSRGAGPQGWNAQQGFYVYRNGRMIVAGGYLDYDLKSEPHYSLARIMVNITNDMDHEWSIDVRKAVASPPDRLRAELLRISRVTRQRAQEVYRTRTGIARRQRQSDTIEDVWVRRQIGGIVVYRLNSDNPVLRRILGEMNTSKKLTDKLFHVIENTVPHRLIIMDGWENENCHIDLPVDLHSPPEGLLEYCRDMYQHHLDRGRTHDEAVDIVCSIQPFDTHPGYRAHLDSTVEGS